MGKLFYSIGDICFVLDESPWHVRDALTAAGVPMIHGGKAADLSRWWSGVVEEPNGNVLIIDGNHCTNPGPDDVVVSSDLLPESWRRRLEGVDDVSETKKCVGTGASAMEEALAALERNQGNKSHAAKELGIHTKTLRRRLGIDGTVKKGSSSPGGANNPFNLGKRQAR